MLFQFIIKIQWFITRIIYFNTTMENGSEV